jgi:uncharacterized ferredoxin-like protein
MPEYDYTQHLLEVARMMELAARTAPKTRGEDFIEIKIISGDDIVHLADMMLAFGKEKNKPGFGRDAGNLRKSTVAMLIGLKDTKTAGLDCGACGYGTCAGLGYAVKPKSDFAGPICSLRVTDLGIALGSAVKTAQLFNVDNRIMYRVGVAARFGGLVDWEMVMGIPLSATGKSIYFDRPQ